MNRMPREQKEFREQKDLREQIDLREQLDLSEQIDLREQIELREQRNLRKQNELRKQRSILDAIQGGRDGSDRRRGLEGHVREKLASKAGESLTETLVAVLIVSLASILLVTMVQASRRVITRSGSAYSDYISEHNDLAVESSSQGSHVSGAPESITIAPADNVKEDDYSLSEIKEKVSVKTAEDGNTVFFPGESSDN